MFEWSYHVCGSYFEGNHMPRNANGCIDADTSTFVNMRPYKRRQKARSDPIFRGWVLFCPFAFTSNRYQTLNISTMLYRQPKRQLWTQTLLPDFKIRSIMKSLHFQNIFCETKSISKYVVSASFFCPSKQTNYFWESKHYVCALQNRTCGVNYQNRTCLKLHSSALTLSDKLRKLSGTLPITKTLCEL